MKTKYKSLFLVHLLLIVGPVILHAQDSFEIQVYEYDTVPKGMWNLETHLNYVGSGSKSFDGTVAPTNNQAHFTFELTRGLTDYFELAGYLVLGRRVGEGLEYAGWRVRPRISLPRSWHLPIDISLSAEVGFPQDVYEENSATLEVRPILEKRLGRYQLDFNPVIGRALKGPGQHEGWEFEPAARVGYEWNSRLDLSLEYYGALGPLGDLLPEHEQVHQFYPGADIKLSENVVWNVGVGVAATEAGNQLVYKTRIGILFGRKHH